jgi:hypothetical protein
MGNKANEYMLKKIQRLGLLKENTHYAFLLIFQL